MIEVLANMVRKKHTTAVKKAEFFTIMVDGTTDKNGKEIQGVVARFFSLEEEKIEEQTLNIGKSGRSAKEIFEFVRESLKMLDINFDRLVCQTLMGLA